MSGFEIRDAARSGTLALLASLTIPLLSGCAGTTIGSGVGDAMLERPPFYAGRPASPARTVHTAVVYQRGDAVFDPVDDPGSALALLIADMNAFLDSLGATEALPEAAVLIGRGPDVQFRCEVDVFDECTTDEEASGAEPRMRLAVTRPSQEWTNALAAALGEAGADRLLLITVETSDYFPRQINWRGGKAIELGTSYAVSLPWLTALDRPISVLQLTGALVGADGRAIRIGAEGMLARRTNLLEGAVGAQRLISDEDIAALRAARREDLPGQPPVWQVALENLVAGLLGGPRPIAP